MADKFFTVTESPVFKKYFMKFCTPIAKSFGFTRNHVAAAYKLLTRPFWKLQYWFFKWIFTAGPLRSIQRAGGGADFKKAQGACSDFVNTVDLGGAIMMKFKTFPQVAAAGATLVGGCKIAR